LDQVSERLIQAVIMGEDAGFYTHHGFDFYEMRESIKRNWERGGYARGASTITQQLAKNLFLSTEKSISRKIKEAILAYRLEKALSKKRILEIYLNVIEWGEDLYGVEAAARTYFGKRAIDLDAAEAALLAGMIPNPRRLNPATNMKSLKTRQERILAWMEMAGHLTEDQCQRAREQRLELRIQRSSE
jgi:monofunctional biosynthetic peptidoglycan transglycosylase